MHAHVDNEGMEFYNLPYRQPHERAVWLYMPVGKDEFISEIWKRQGRGGYEMALIVRKQFFPPDMSQLIASQFGTNKGRIAVLGSFYVATYGHCTYTLLQKLTSKPSRVSFDVNPTRIRQLAFEDEIFPTSRDPVVPRPLSRCPRSAMFENFIYTSADLENLVEITPCEKTSAGCLAVIGLLLHYSNGDRAAVGQFRLDCAGQPISTRGSHSIWLSFGNKSGCPFVVAFGIFPPPTAPSQIHLEFVCAGRLEWWFSYRQCKIYLGHQESPETMHNDSGQGVPGIT